ncbi:MAG: BMP family ABC transporter substrate-binding protein [Tissierellaceae bacterium]|nr:BMP family ABC transporter substrate-binding protein [Tissierellaceae bacterium]
MKKYNKIILLAIAAMLVLTACTQGSDSDNGKVDSDGTYKNIMFVVTGTLGGRTNNDDVLAAINDYVATVDGNVDTFECNMDASLYESTLMQVAETGEYDLIVTGFGTMIEPVANTAAKYADQKFLIFDTQMDYSNGANSNVVSVQVLQNEGGFLAGALAAELTTSNAEYANEDKVVGFVGAMESTAILDFLMGYIDGVNYVDPSIEVLYSFVGNHTDSALAKELGLSQYQQGADVVFAVGQNGLGVAEAAADANKYLVGVDFDYSERLETTNKNAASKVLTSVIKDYRGMVYPILEAINEGTIEWGSHRFISHAEEGVYLVNNDYTQAIVPEEVWTEYQKVVEELNSGSIEVSTAFGASTDEIEEVKSQAKPQ